MSRSHVSVRLTRPAALQLLGLRSVNPCLWPCHTLEFGQTRSMTLALSGYCTHTLNRCHLLSSGQYIPHIKQINPLDQLTPTLSYPATIYITSRLVTTSPTLLISHLVHTSSFHLNTPITQCLFPPMPLSIPPPRLPGVLSPSTPIPFLISRPLRHRTQLPHLLR